MQQQQMIEFKKIWPNEVIFAVPNGGLRSVLVAKKLQKEGVLPGVADLFLLKACGGFHGLFIENKVGNGVLSEKQKKFSEAAKREGYKYEIVRSVEEFIEIVRQYLLS